MHRRLLYLLLLLQSLRSEAHAAQPMVLGTFPAAEPTFIICQRALEEAYMQLGLNIRVEHLPGARALQSAMNGITDGELCRSTSIEAGAPTLVRVSTALTTATLVAFATQPLPIKDWASLAPYEIIYERGAKAIELQLAGMTSFPANSTASAFRQLQAGRHQVYVKELYSGLDMLKQLGFKDVIALQPPLQKYPMYHYLNRRHAALIPRLSQVLEAMARSGRLAQIKLDVLHEMGFPAPELSPAPSLLEPAKFGSPALID
jgi:polar amino acid transport system substrate-binding protein